jgi:hypothetical protein
LSSHFSILFFLSFHFIFQNLYLFFFLFCS